MAKAGTDALEAALQEAATGEAESATAKTEEAEATEETAVASEDGQKSNTVPYSRFKEINDKFKAASEKETDLTSRLDESAQSISKLTELLDKAKEDSDVVNDIRGLALDDRYKEHIEIINNALLGIEEEVEEGDITPEQADTKARKLLESQQEQLAEAIADTRADTLIARADAVADKWLSALPEEYDEKDREIIARLWTDSMDWDNIVEDPSQLDPVLQETFQEVIDTYGVPRGSLVAPPEETEETDTTPERTPEEELEEIIGSTEWGAMKDVETPTGKTVKMPEISDDDFTESLAAAMKVGNAS